MDNNLQKNQEFLRLSKIKIKSLVNDELFFEVIEKELKIEQIDTENELIILSLDNKFVLNQFIENYLNDFNKIFNSISENKYVLTFDGVKQNTSTYKTEIYGVNKEMNFNNITVGQFNEVAILYGKKIANDKSWKVFFIVGSTGTGKTYLLNAIANEYSLKNKTRNILLINAVELGQKIFNNFKNTAQIQKIKNEIISHELILIDDVQYFIKRPSILEILNEIVSLVKTKNKIIIFASSLTSNKYKIANRTFSALLSSGMDCMLSHTHLIDKKKIIINEINRQNLNFELTNDALEYLASRNVDGNLNKLITLIDKIGIYVLQDGIKILTKSDIEKITNTLKYETHSYIAAIEIICKYFDIDSDVIFSPSRIKNIVNVRNICMYFLYKKFNLSLKKIGNLFGNRSHSTIKHGIEKINLIITNKTKQLSQLNDIEKLL